MPGDPKECRQHALACVRLAQTSAAPQAREQFASLARTWIRLADDVVEAAEAALGFGGEVAAAVEAVQAATGAGGAAFGSGAFIDIARLPWPGLTRSGFAFVTGCTGQPIFGRMGMMRAISSRKRV